MGGRRNKPRRYQYKLRIRYRDEEAERNPRTSGRPIRTKLIVTNNRKRLKGFRGGRILNIQKIGEEEQMGVGEFNNLVKAPTELLPRWLQILEQQS